MSLENEIASSVLRSIILLCIWLHGSSIAPLCFPCCFLFPAPIMGAFRASFMAVVTHPSQLEYGAAHHCERAACAAASLTCLNINPGLIINHLAPGFGYTCLQRLYRSCSIYLPYTE